MSDGCWYDSVLPLLTKSVISLKTSGCWYNSVLSLRIKSTISLKFQPKDCWTSIWFCIICFDKIYYQPKFNRKITERWDFVLYALTKSMISLTSFKRLLDLDVIHSSQSTWWKSVNTPSCFFYITKTIWIVLKT